MRRAKNVKYNEHIELETLAALDYLGSVLPYVKTGMLAHRLQIKRNTLSKRLARYWARGLVTKSYKLEIESVCWEIEPEGKERLEFLRKVLK